ERAAARGERGAASALKGVRNLTFQLSGAQLGMAAPGAPAAGTPSDNPYAQPSPAAPATPPAAPSPAPAAPAPATAPAPVTDPPQSEDAR
ncbi:hypothetical protein ABZ841_06495, partial [Streptomyces flaveolus]